MRSRIFRQIRDPRGVSGSSAFAFASSRTLGRLYLIEDLQFYIA
jgi:hypothetical protein